MPTEVLTSSGGSSEIGLSEFKAALHRQSYPLYHYCGGMDSSFGSLKIEQDANSGRGNSGRGSASIPPAKIKQSKSRNGCRTCKQKRLKCDETHPFCDQCKRRGVKCDGYDKDFKWKNQTPKSMQPNKRSAASSKSRSGSRKGSGTGRRIPRSDSPGLTEHLATLDERLALAADSNRNTPSLGQTTSASASPNIGQTSLESSYDDLSSFQSFNAPLDYPASTDLRSQYGTPGPFGGSERPSLTSTPSLSYSSPQDLAAAYQMSPIALHSYQTGQMQHSYVPSDPNYSQNPLGLGLSFQQQAGYQEETRPEVMWSHQTQQSQQIQIRPHESFQQQHSDTYQQSSHQGTYEQQIPQMPPSMADYLPAGQQQYQSQLDEQYDEETGEYMPMTRGRGRGGPPMGDPRGYQPGG